MAVSPVSTSTMIDQTDDLINSYLNSSHNENEHSAPTSAADGYENRLSFLLAAVREAASLTSDSPIPQDPSQLVFTGSIDKVILLLTAATNAVRLFKDGQSYVELPPSNAVLSLALPEAAKEYDATLIIRAAFRKGNPILASDFLTITVFNPSLSGHNLSVFGIKSSRAHDLPAPPFLEKLKAKDNYCNLPNIGNGFLRETLRVFSDSRRNAEANQLQVVTDFLAKVKGQTAKMVSYASFKECVAFIYKFLPPEHVPYFGVHPGVSAVFPQYTPVTTDDKYSFAGKAAPLLISHSGPDPYACYKDLLSRSRETSTQDKDYMPIYLVHVGDIVLPEAARSRPALLASKSGFTDPHFLSLMQMVLLSLTLPGIHFPFQHFDREHFDFLITSLGQRPVITLAGPRPIFLLSFLKTASGSITAASYLDGIATTSFNDLLSALQSESFRKCHVVKPSETGAPITVKSISGLWKKPVVSSPFGGDVDLFDLSMFETNLDEELSPPSTKPKDTSDETMEDLSKNANDAMDVVKEKIAEPQKEAADSRKKRK